MSTENRKIELTNDADARELTSYKSWYDLDDQGRKDIDRDFAYCLEHNPGPFALHEVVYAQTVHQGENDGKPWLWDVLLKRDGKFVGYYAVGSCDYTGWDCQSGGWYVSQND